MIASESLYRELSALLAAIPAGLKSGTKPSSEVPIWLARAYALEDAGGDGADKSRGPDNPVVHGGIDFCVKAMASDLGNSGLGGKDSGEVVG